MRMRLSSAGGLVIAMAFLAACNARPTPQERERGAEAFEVEAIAAAQSPFGRAAERVTRVENDADGWEILDVGSDGAVLYGRRLDAGGPRQGLPSFSVRLLEAGRGAAALEVGAEPLVDARLRPSADRQVAVVSPSGRLSLWRPDGRVRFVDEQVAPGMSFAPDGSCLVYAKGQRPELDIFASDLSEAGAPAAPLPSPQQLTRDQMPDYLPAVSADGRILWVSSQSGIGSLWRMTRAGKSARQLTNVGLRPGRRAEVWRAIASPNGRVPPLWAGGWVVFFDGRGVSVVSETTGKLAGHIAGARSPHWLSVGERFAFELDPGVFKAARLGEPEGSR